MKIILSLFLVVFSFNAFAVKESSLNSEQKTVLYEIHSLIENEYPVESSRTDSNESDSFEAEFAKASAEFEMIISSVKTFAEKVELPLQNFLETNLAKYVGVMVVLEFFGEPLFSYLTWIVFVLVAFGGLNFTTNLAKVNYGKIQENEGFSKKHGTYKYDTIVLKEELTYPVMKYISLALLTLLLFINIF